MPTPTPPASPGEILGADDPRFERFTTAILLEERVRVTYRTPLNDPAVQMNFIPTVTQGKARMLDDDNLVISIATVESGEFAAAGQMIPRNTITDIEFLGPRPVPAEDMV